MGLLSCDKCRRFGERIMSLTYTECKNLFNWKLSDRKSEVINWHIAGCRYWRKRLHRLWLNWKRSVRRFWSTRRSSVSWNTSISCTLRTNSSALRSVHRRQDVHDFLCCCCEGCSWSYSQPFAIQITSLSSENLCVFFMNSYSLVIKQKSHGARTTHLLTCQLKHWLPSKMPSLNCSVSHRIRYSYFYCMSNTWLEDQ